MKKAKCSLVNKLPSRLLNHKKGEKVFRTHIINHLLLAKRHQSEARQQKKNQSQKKENFLKFKENIERGYWGEGSGWGREGKIVRFFKEKGGRVHAP